MGKRRKLSNIWREHGGRRRGLLESLRQKMYSILTRLLLMRCFMNGCKQTWKMQQQAASMEYERFYVCVEWMWAKLSGQNIGVNGGTTFFAAEKWGEKFRLLSVCVWWRVDWEIFYFSFLLHLALTKIFFSIFISRWSCRFWNGHFYRVALISSLFFRQKSQCLSFKLPLTKRVAQISIHMI